MKKLLVLFLCVVLCLCGTVTAFAAEGENVTVEIGTAYNAKANQEIAVNITLSDVTFSYALIEIVDIIYDPEVLSLVYCDKGDFNGLYGISESEIAFITTTAHKNNKGGVFATLYFKALCDIKEPTEISVSADIATYDDSEINYNTKANVTVVPGGVKYCDSFGDIDDNGIVSAIDALLLFRYVTGTVAFNSKQVAIADVNSDNEVNTEDVIRVLQMAIENDISTDDNANVPAERENVKLAVESTRGKKGEIITMPVTVSGITAGDLALAVFKVNYDPAVLKLVPAKTEKLLNNVEGTVITCEEQSLVAFIVPYDYDKAQGRIFNLTFEVLADLDGVTTVVSIAPIEAYNYTDTNRSYEMSSFIETTAATLKKVVYGKFLPPSAAPDAPIVPGEDPDTTIEDLENTDVLANDALLTLQSAVGKIEYTEEQRKCIDVNADGKISAADALLILQFAVGKITEFPCETI